LWFVDLQLILQQASIYSAQTGRCLPIQNAEAGQEKVQEGGLACSKDLSKPVVYIAGRDRSQGASTGAKLQVHRATASAPRDASTAIEIGTASSRLRLNAIFWWIATWP
jgi:hypothetical protein